MPADIYYDGKFSVLLCGKKVEAVCILVKLQNCSLVCQLFPH